MGRKLDMRWSFGMRYIIATLKDGDDDGWAEAQLIKLAEDLDENNESEDADPIEVPRHGDTLDIEALAEEVGAHVLYLDKIEDLPKAPSRAMSIPYPPEKKKEVTK